MRNETYIMYIITIILIIYSSVITCDYFKMKEHKDNFRKLYLKESDISNGYYKDIVSKRERISQLEHQIDDLYNEKNIIREVCEIKDINATIYIKDRNLEFYTGNDIKKKLAISMADKLIDYMEYYIDSESFTNFGRGVHGRIKIISKED